MNGVSFNYDLSYTGASDLGWNISAPGTMYAGGTASEMAFMHYNNLGNTGYYNTDGTQSRCSPIPCLANRGPFPELQRYLYWSATGDARNPGQQWYFNFLNGAQSLDTVTGKHAWPVLDGDVATVPVPAALYLLVSALGLMPLGRHRQRA